MSIFPIELYEIIIGYIPIPCYGRIRLICKDWTTIVEQSDYIEVIRFIRTLNKTPVFIDECDIDIRLTYYNGHIIVKSLNTENLAGLHFIEYKLTYHDKQFYKIDRTVIHEINNIYGRFTLYHRCLCINGEFTIMFPGIGSHIIQADTEIIITTSSGLYGYNKYNDTWYFIQPIDENLHTKKNMKYRKNGHTIIIIKNDVELGTISLSSSDFGFGPTYFVMSNASFQDKTDKLFFWDYE